MFKRSILATALVALAIPATANARSASDGYEFEERDKSFNNVNLRKVEYDSQRELLAAAEAYAEQMDAEGKDSFAFRVRITQRRLVAWSTVNGNQCTIHMVKPEVRYEPEFVGHELMHCFYGDFHPEA